MVGGSPRASSMPDTSLWYTVPGVGTICEGDTAATVIPSYCRDLLRQTLRKPLQRRFDRAIHRAATYRLVGVRAAPWTNSRSGADVDDGAAAPGQHVPQHLLRQHEWPVHIDREGAKPPIRVC